MANQRNHSPRESADQRSEILSDSTDLDTLLEAILSDDVARVPAAVAPPEVPIVAGREASVIGGPWPTFLSPLNFPAQPDLNSGRSAVTEDEAEAAWAADLKEFTAAVKNRDPQATEQRDPQAYEQSGAAKESAVFIESAIPRRTWRDKTPALTTKPSLLVASLCAVALVVIVAILLRDGPDDKVVVPPAPAAVTPAPVPPTLIVAPASPAAAPVVPPTVKVTAARGATAEPRVVTPRSSRRSNERTEPARADVQPQNIQAPTEAPVIVPPIAVQRVVDEPANVAAPTRRTIPDSDPRPATSASVPTAAAATEAGAPQVVPTSVSAPPPAVAGRTPPRLLEGSSPEYPAALRTARVGGSVEVRFAIDSSGRPINVQSVSGPPQLRSVAEAAVRRWRYAPAKLGNVAVETQTSVNFNFDPSPARRPQD